MATETPRRRHGEQPWRQRSVLSGDLRLAVREYGDTGAPTLVAVHGYPDNQRMWEPVARLLQRDFHVVTYDVRGAGESEAPKARGDYVTERLVDDLVAVMDATTPGQEVHLLGHDWGSLQLWDAVTSERDDTRLRGRLASYTSISGPSLDHMAHFARTGPIALRRRQARRSWYVSYFHVPVLPDVTWRVLGPVIGRQMTRREQVPREAGWGPELARDADNGLELYRANIYPRLRSPRAGRTDVPVQIVAPLRDPFLAPETLNAIDFDRFLTTWRKVEVDTGHWVPRTHPELVARLTTEWALHR
jgi:pimeloyl-ACP methyl ester carboxylesterase